MDLQYITTLLVCWATLVIGVRGGPSTSIPTTTTTTTIPTTTTTTTGKTHCAYYEGQEVQRVYHVGEGDDGGVAGGGDSKEEDADTTTSGIPQDKVVTVQVETDAGMVSVEECGATDSCFSYWIYEHQPETNTTAVKWFARGCWGGNKGCDQSACAGYRIHVDDTDSYFCCCSGSMCNDDVSILNSTEVITPSTIEPKPTDSQQYTYVVVWVILAVAFILAVTCITGAAVRWRRTKPVAQTLPDDDPPTSPCIDMDSIKFMEVLGQGRFGTAYRAVTESEEVAVKLFPQHHKSSYQNEKYIYSLPLMEHSNLLLYLGGGECVGPDGNIYYGLVLSYCPKGRLSSYLAENTLSWSTFCSIVLSATRGLAHLHSDIRKGDIIKPVISHRDFNTRNLLLTGNLTCVVSDLGFAIHTQGSKYYVNGEEQHAETSSLTDVGTLRYMAPEVLEGAVNLRDCEAALKQIDIYALGLVLWECAARCHDLYQGLQTPPYKLPFQAEIGLHPTFEQVQVLVTRNKARPLFPSVWKATNPAIRLLKETIEDCWDHDAEARLSAMCVEGRLSELPVLWDRYKSSLGVNGVSPTINPMSNLVVTQRQGDMFGGLIGNGGKVISNAITPRDKESSVSETTVETTVTASPSEPAPDLCLAKNQLIGTLQPLMPALQPHQGRNPCIARNLIREVPQDFCVEGNILIDQSRNTVNTDNFMDALEVQNVLASHGIVNEQLMPLLNGHSNTSAVASQPRQPLPPPNLLPPIPYLQNEVRSMDNQPKRQNTAAQEENQENGHSSSSSSGRGGSWRRWRSTWEDRLKLLIPRRRHHHSEDEERQEILVTPTSSSLSEPPTPLTSSTQSAAVTANHLPLQTEVLLSNGGPHTVISPTHNLNTQLSSLPDYIAATEIGIAKLHLHNGFAPIIRSRQGSNDSGLNKSSENSFSFADSDNSCEKLKRPTTLILPERLEKGQNNKTVNQEVKQLNIKKVENTDRAQPDPPKETTETTPPLRKAKQRVKTPRRPLNPRLSLYDDRIMGCENQGTGHGGAKDEGQLEVSLSHSLPLYMDTLEQQQPFLNHNDVVMATAASPTQNTSAASLRHHKVASNNCISSSSNDSSSNSSSSRGSIRLDSSQGSLGQELPFTHIQPNPQAVGVL